MLPPFWNNFTRITDQQSTPAMRVGLSFSRSPTNSPLLTIKEIHHRSDRPASARKTTFGSVLDQSPIMLR